MSELELKFESGGIAAAKTDFMTFKADTPRPGLIRADFDDGLELETLGAQLGKTPDTLAVQEKRRINVERDGLEQSIFMRGVIPFGAEPAIARKVALTGQSLKFSTTLELRKSFEFDRLCVDSFKVGGPIAKIGLVKAPAKSAELPKPEWHDFEEFDQLEMSEPPIKILFETGSGSSLEISNGEALWRWTSATWHGGICRFTLKKEEGAIKFFRDIFLLQEGAAPGNGWNWNLYWRATWRKGKEKASRKRKFKATFDFEKQDWPEAAFCLVGGKRTKTPCLSSQAVGNLLKSWLRSQLANLEEGDVLALKNVKTTYCESSSHQDRPKFDKLPHWGLEPLFEFSAWAERQISPYGASLLILEK